MWVIPITPWVDRGVCQASAVTAWRADVAGRRAAPETATECTVTVLAIRVARAAPAQSTGISRFAAAAMARTWQIRQDQTGDGRPACRLCATRRCGDQSHRESRADAARDSGVGRRAEGTAPLTPRLGRHAASNRDD